MFDLFWHNGLLIARGAWMPNETCLDSLKVLALLPRALGVLIGCSVFGFWRVLCTFSSRLFDGVCPQVFFVWWWLDSALKFS